MGNALTLLLLVAVLLAPFAVVATIATLAQRSGYLRWHLDQFRFATPMVGRLFEEDADVRRTRHEVDAIRTRFEEHPAWPHSGAFDERS